MDTILRRLFLLAALLFLALPARASIAFVNKWDVMCVAACATKALTVAPANGHCLTAQIWDFGVTVSSVTDNGSNAWAVIVGRTPLNGSGTVGVELWQECNAATAPTTVTVNWSGSNNNAFTISEYSGVGSLGGHTTATGSSTTPSISLTTTANNSYVAAVIGYNTTGAFTVTNGTVRDALNSSSINGSLISADNTAATPSSVTVSGTIASSPWAAIAAELKPAGGAAAPSPLTLVGVG